MKTDENEKNMNNAISDLREMFCFVVVKRGIVYPT